MTNPLLEPSKDPVEIFKKDAPGLMQRLTSLYGEKKDLNERAKLKRQMSAVLAFLATDTPPAGQAPFVQQMDGDGELDETLGGIAPIPGAERVA